MLSGMLSAAGDMTFIAPLRRPAADLIKSLEAEGKLSLANFRIVEPMGYLAFGRLTAHARGVVTDSGNVAEEATFNQVPCITLNSYTEHIETVKQGTNVLVGEDADRLREAVATLVRGEWKAAGIPDRWDGRSAERIVQILLEQGQKAR